MRQETQTDDDAGLRSLREEIRAGNVWVINTLAKELEESQRPLRVLVGDLRLVSRIATLQAQSGRTRPKERP
jgi:hypothetical protein